MTATPLTTGSPTFCAPQAIALVTTFELHLVDPRLSVSATAHPRDAGSSQDSDFTVAMMPEDADIQLTGRAYDVNNLGSNQDPAYEQWTVEKLRVECRSRGIKLHANTKKAARIQALRDFDNASPSLLRALGRDGATVARVPQRTPSCIFRLLNLLFSNQFAERFGDIGDTLSRAQLDSATTARMAFWRDASVAYREPNPNFDSLIVRDDLFNGILPSTIVRHSPQKLQEMWKTVNSNFILANENFRKSGTHEAEFRNFIGSHADTLYLFMWLKLKPQLNNFVLGGMLEVDQFDSIRGDLHRLSTPQKKRRTNVGDATPPSRSSTPQRSTGNEPMARLAADVSGYIKSRSQTEASRTSSTLRVLEDLREAISRVEDAMESATDSQLERLEEDLQVYTKKRKRLHQELLDQE